MRELEFRVNMYLRHLADGCGFRDMEVRWDPSVKTSAEAEIEIEEEQLAHVYLGEKFFERLPAEQRDILVHEVCHMAFARLHTAVEHIRDRGADGALIAWLESAEEYAAEHHARLLKGRFAVPAFPEEEP